MCLVSIGWMWRENPKIAEYMHKGYKAWESGNFTEAQSDYERALDLKPNQTDALNMLGVIYEEMRLPEKAEEKYLTVIRIDKKYLSAYFNLGILYWNQGDTQKATEYFQKRIQLGSSIDPWTMKAAEALRSIQTSKLVRRQIEVNQTVDETMYRNYPRKHDAFVYRSLDEAEQQLKSQEALEETNLRNTHEAPMLTSGKEVSQPDSAEAQLVFAHGQELAQHQQYQEAIAAYDRALRMTPGDPQIIKAKVAAYLEWKQQSDN